MTHRPRSSAPGFSLVEAVIAVVIVGGLVMAALNTVGASQTRQFKNAASAMGNMLAQDLMAEILQLPYIDPSSSSTALGVNAGESQSASNRLGLDDVDDYHGFTETSIKRRDGSSMDLPDGWSRSVVVDYVDRNNLSTTVTTSQGVKRIRVTASFRNVPVATVTAYRTEAWQANTP